MRLIAYATIFGAAAFHWACTDADLVVNIPVVPEPDEPAALVDEVRPIADVDRVVLKDVGAIYIEQGDVPELRVRAEELVLSHLSTTIQNGVLTIGFQESFSLDHKLVLECFLTVPNLEAIHVDGLWRVEGSGLHTSPLSVVLDGIGEVELVDLRTSRLALTHSGVGTVVASGAASALAVDLWGAGPFHGRRLFSDHAVVIVRGSGSATVAARDSLSAHIEGTGSVYYYGDPVVKRTGEGTGRVVRSGS